jgi:hypothetical protein
MQAMYKIPTITRRLGVLALLLLASPLVVPQQSGRFTIEIVVFRTASQTGALIGTEPSQPVSGADVEPTSVANRRLAGAASRLRGANGFRVLAHTAWTQGAASFNSRRGVSATKLGINSAGINGKVILERGRLLHLGIDLTIDDGGRRYHISEVRPVKADEAQYFDHPSVGIIALVTAGG